MKKPYYVKRVLYGFKWGIIDNGWQVRKRVSGPALYYSCFRLRCDEPIIAQFDDGKTARAVCRDLNAGADHAAH